MDKKTIIYTGGFELPDKNAAAQRVLANAKIFRELGYNVVLIGIDKSLPASKHIKDTKVIVEGFETWSVSYPSNKKAWLNYITTAKPLEYIISKFHNEDIHGIICYNYPAIVQYKIKKVCHQYNALYIPDATEWYESSGGGILFNTIKWLDTSIRMRFVHPNADGIITTSKYLTDFYTKQNCMTVELPTLYDVNSLHHFHSTEKPKDIVKLMYAGSAFNLERIDKNRTTIKDRLDKIIIMLHKVYQQKTNFTFDIYGLTKENYLSVFPEHSDIINKLANVITFHGRKPHSIIVENIQKSDFTIFLRNIERVIEAGFPSKFSESISYGTPVISNMISNIERYAVEGKNSYIISLEDEEGQVRKMVQILSLNIADRQSMKDYCLENKIFDYRKYVGMVKDFLQNIEKKYEINKNFKDIFGV